MMPDLGIYAVYVLSAYGVSLTMLVVLVLASWRRARRVKAALDRIEERARNG